MIELLAEEFHVIWMEYAQTMIRKKRVNPRTMKRWEALMVPYRDLTHFQKEKDRRYARRVLRFFKKHGHYIKHGGLK